MDSTGREHLVHSTLLRLKIPLFRCMEIEPSSTILMDFASPEVVELLCEVVYGSDRWFIQIVTCQGWFWYGDKFNILIRYLIKECGFSFEAIVSSELLLTVCAGHSMPHTWCLGSISTLPPALEWKTSWTWRSRLHAASPACWSLPQSRPHLCHLPRLCALPHLWRC